VNVFNSIINKIEIEIIFKIIAELRELIFTKAKANSKSSKEKREVCSVLTHQKLLKTDFK
jgi:hypothetical protein